MLAAVRRRAAAFLSRPQPSGQAGDGGFTLIEIIISIAVVDVLVAALAGFVTLTLSVNNQLSGRQTAVQLAEDGIERVRALKGSDLLTGRSQAQVDAQWSTPFAGVDLTRVLSGMVKAYDTTVPLPGVAPLPTSSQDVPVNGMTFKQQWYVGRCWLPAGSEVCGTSVTAVALFRVVVVVAWSEQGCAGGTCSFVTSTLVDSTATDPLFTGGGP